MSHVRGRRGHARNGAAGRTLAQRVASILAGGALFRADRFTPTGGNVLNFVDVLDSTHVATVTGTLTAPVVDVTMPNGTARTSNFTGTQYATSNRTPTYWRPLHASASTGLHVFVPVDVGSAQIYVATRSSTGGDTGMSFYHNGASSNGYVSNAGVAAVDALIPAALTTQVPTYTEYELSAGSYRYAQKSAAGATGVPGALAAGDPSGSLTIGSPTGGPPFAGVFRFWGFLYAPRTVTAAELSVLRSYIFAETGITP